MSKVAIVTGASGGIGRAIAIELAKDGYTIIANYNGSYEKAQAVAEECQKYTAESTTYQCNVADFNQVKTMITEVAKKYGRIDVLVNNSGITRDKLILRMNEQDFTDVIDINLKGCFNCTQNVSKIMLKQKSGVIINVASVIGVIGNAGQTNYAASKAGVIGFTKSVAKELVGVGIRCNAIAPGFIESEMTAKLTDEQKENILNHIPMKKMGTGEDIANIISFLISEKARYITGQVLHVDGGMVM